MNGFWTSHVLTVLFSLMGSPASEPAQYRELPKSPALMYNFAQLLSCVCSVRAERCLQALMGSHLPRWERALCYGLIPVMLVLSVVGVGSSVASLVRQVRQR